MNGHEGRMKKNPNDASCRTSTSSSSSSSSLHPNQLTTIVPTIGTTDNNDVVDEDASLDFLAENEKEEKDDVMVPTKKQVDWNHHRQQQDSKPNYQDMKTVPCREGRDRLSTRIANKLAKEEAKKEQPNSTSHWGNGSMHSQLSSGGTRRAERDRKRREKVESTPNKQSQRSSEGGGIVRGAERQRKYREKVDQFSTPNEDRNDTNNWGHDSMHSQHSGAGGGTARAERQRKYREKFEAQQGDPNDTNNWGHDSMQSQHSSAGGGSARPGERQRKYREKFAAQQQDQGDQIDTNHLGHDSMHSQHSSVGGGSSRRKYLDKFFTQLEEQNDANTWGHDSMHSQRSGGGKTSRRKYREKFATSQQQQEEGEIWNEDINWGHDSMHSQRSGCSTTRSERYRKRHERKRSTSSSGEGGAASARIVSASSSIASTESLDTFDIVEEDGPSRGNSHDGGGGDATGSRSTTEVLRRLRLDKTYPMREGGMVNDSSNNVNEHEQSSSSIALTSVDNEDVPSMIALRRQQRTTYSSNDEEGFLVSPIQVPGAVHVDGPYAGFSRPPMDWMTEREEDDAVHDVEEEFVVDAELYEDDTTRRPSTNDDAVPCDGPQHTTTSELVEAKVVTSRRTQRVMGLCIVVVVGALVLVIVLMTRRNNNSSLPPGLGYLPTTTATTTNNSTVDVNESGMDTSVFHTWIPVGSDIVGLTEQSNFGSVFDMSDDGTLLVLMDRDSFAQGIRTTKMQMYRYWTELNEWIQSGMADFLGEYAVYGSISMDANGTFLAMGQGNLVKSINYARIFRNYAIPSEAAVTLGDDWRPFGQAEFSDYTHVGGFGNAVSLSGDGTRIAVNSMMSRENENGSVRVFQLNETMERWEIVGQEMVGQEPGDNFGVTLCISGSGTRIAVAANKYTVPSSREYETKNGTQIGYVQVFDYNGTYWNSLGQTLTGRVEKEEFSFSLDMSYDGTVLAIGSPGEGVNKLSKGAGYVQGFKLVEIGTGNGSNSSFHWIQLGGDIVGNQKGDRFGTSVSLSRDGSRVAIGAVGVTTATGMPRAGQVRVYDWIDRQETWIQVGDDFDGVRDDELGATVRLSGDGSILAIGSPHHSRATLRDGYVRVYKEVVSIANATNAMPDGSN